MLKELTIRNFKAWREIKSMKLSRITGLFGSNSSGKSSVIQALLLLKQTLESPDRTLPLHFGGERDYVELGLFKEVIWNHTIENTIYFGFKWDMGEELEVIDPNKPSSVLFSDHKLEFITEIDSPNGEKQRVRNFTYLFDEHQFSLTRRETGNQYDLSPTKVESSGFRFKRNVGKVWHLPKPFKFHGFPDQVITYFQNTGFLLDLQRQLEDQFSKTYYLGPLREYPKRRYTWSGSEPEDVGRRGEKAIDAILAARERENYISRGYKKRHWSLERMLAHWLKELGLIHSFDIRRISKDGNTYQVYVQQSSRAPSVLLTDVGFGVSQILPVLVLCYYVDEGSTIIFEQPEIHLHPSVQIRLADVFIDVAKNRDVQIIVESHSEHLLNRLQRKIAEKEISAEDISLYFCEFKKDRACLNELETDIFGNILNWPEDFFGDRFGEIAAMQKAVLQRKVNEEPEEL